MGLIFGDWSSPHLFRKDKEEKRTKEKRQEKERGSSPHPFLFLMSLFPRTTLGLLSYQLLAWTVPVEWDISASVVLPVHCVHHSQGPTVPPAGPWVLPVEGGRSGFFPVSFASCQPPLSGIHGRRWEQNSNPLSWPGSPERRWDFLLKWCFNLLVPFTSFSTFFWSLPICKELCLVNPMSVLLWGAVSINFILF